MCRFNARRRRPRSAP